MLMLFRFQKRTQAWVMDGGIGQGEEGKRYELIDGVAYAMSAPNDRHQAVSIALASTIYASRVNKLSAISMLKKIR
jgi:hypothetical protein